VGRLIHEAVTVTFEDLRYDTEGHLALITLDRADARNAYSEGMVQSLVQALDQAEADAQVRCIVLTGAGTAFSAGGDLKRMRDHSGMFAGDAAALRKAYVTHIQRIPRRIAQCDKPIIAAVNGAAIGAGLDLACMCDVRLASEKAKFGSTFVKVGLVPGDGGAYFLARTVGLPRALDLMLTGRVFDALEAERYGLVQRVVAPEDLMKEAKAYASTVAAQPPRAIQLTKRAAYRSWDADLETSLELAATYQGIAQRTQDHAEAVQAMLQKRAPSFTGE